MAHCSGRGDELFVGDIAHITIWEQGGVAQVILFYYIILVTCKYGCYFSCLEYCN